MVRFLCPLKFSFTLFDLRFKIEFIFVGILTAEVSPELNFHLTLSFKIEEGLIFKVLYVLIKIKIKINNKGNNLIKY